MPKLTFRRVKEGRISVSMPRLRGLWTANIAKKFVAGSMMVAFVPLSFASSRLPSLGSPAPSAWNTQLVLADVSPELLTTRGSSEVKIEKVTSRYEEEEKQKREKERQRKRVIAAQTVPMVSGDTMSEAEKLELAAKAANAWHIPPSLLVAVWKVESGMRAFTVVQNKTSGAAGPFQFMPGTWRGYAVDGNGDGIKNVADARDAAYAAAQLLARNGAAQGDYYRALRRYNNADWYAQKVLSMAGLKK